MEVYSSLLIVAMVLALSYLAYSQVPSPTHSSELVFGHYVYEISGSPSLIFIQINSSATTRMLDFVVDEASSQSGILALEGSKYATIQSLCTSGGTSFFSVYASTPGTLSVNTNGRSWIDGVWTGQMQVNMGWHEVILNDATSCFVTLPTGQVLGGITAGVSTLPILGQPNSAFFRAYLPFSGGHHDVNAVFDRGMDAFAIP